MPPRRRAAGEVTADGFRYRTRKRRRQEVGVGGSGAGAAPAPASLVAGRVFKSRGARARAAPPLWAVAEPHAGPPSVPPYPEVDAPPLRDCNVDEGERRELQIFRELDTVVRAEKRAIRDTFQLDSAPMAQKRAFLAAPRRSPPRRRD